MSKPKTTVKARSLVNKYQENCDAILEIHDLCEKEERERTEEEDKIYKALVRENSLLEMKMHGLAGDHLRENLNSQQEAERIIRENTKAGRKTEIIFMRDVMMVGDVANGGLVPINIQSILEPLEEGLILDKVGLPMPTGLTGEFVWPMYEMCEAELCGEGVALSDQEIPFSKMTAAPERVGIAIPATHQSLNQSQGLLEDIIRKVMPKAIQKLLNKILFGREKANGTTNLTGPFFDCENTIELSSVPTFYELNRLMKAEVLSTGIDGENLCWVMSKSMEAILEGTPINEKGIFVPMIQNHILCGLPVYTSNVMRDDDGTENIGLGDWRYQPMGLFNSFRFVIDPYSQSRKDCVDFNLNCDYATKTLRKEAFILGTVAKAPAPEPTKPGEGDNDKGGDNQ